MVIKLLKTTDKNKILKAARKKKRHITFQGANKGKIRLSAIFPKKTKQNSGSKKIME